MFKVLVVWYNKNKNSYYYKIVSGFYVKYYPGYINRYNHEVIIVVDLYKELYMKPPLKKRVLKRLISFLQKIDKKI